MTLRASFVPLVLGLALVPSSALCQAPTTPSPSATPPGSSTRPAAPATAPRVYTNDDLDRVRPYRDEMGAQSVPAFETTEVAPAPQRQRRGSRSVRTGEQDESYWRREAGKVRERVRHLESERDGLQARLDQRQDDERRVLRRDHGARVSSSDSARALQTRIASIERRIRELEQELAERARVAGALPGWLR